MPQIYNLNPQTSEPSFPTVKKHIAPLRGTFCYEKLQLLHRCFSVELISRESNPGKLYNPMLYGATNVELIWGLHQISKELVRILMFFESSRNEVRCAVRNSAMGTDDLPLSSTRYDALIRRMEANERTHRVEDDNEEAELRVLAEDLERLADPLTIDEYEEED